MGKLCVHWTSKLRRFISHWRAILAAFNVLNHWRFEFLGLTKVELKLSQIKNFLILSLYEFSPQKSTIFFLIRETGRISTTLARPRKVVLILDARSIRKIVLVFRAKNPYHSSMAIYSDIYGTAEFRGIEIPIIGEAEIVYEDRSFSHEFGVEHDASWEVENVDNIIVDGEPKKLVIEALHDIGLTNHNRRFKKNARRLVKQMVAFVGGLDYEAFTESQMEASISNADTEPDYDPPDREPGVSSFSFD
jgi:hypothetical protein